MWIWIQKTKTPFTVFIFCKNGYNGISIIIIIIIIIIISEAERNSN